MNDSPWTSKNFTDFENETKERLLRALQKDLDLIRDGLLANVERVAGMLTTEGYRGAALLGLALLKIQITRSLNVFATDAPSTENKPGE